jgi:hypothetical protein
MTYIITAPTTLSPSIGFLFVFSFETFKYNESDFKIIAMMVRNMIPEIESKNKHQAPG